MMPFPRLSRPRTELRRTDAVSRPLRHVSRTSSPGDGSPPGLGPSSAALRPAPTRSARQSVLPRPGAAQHSRSAPMAPVCSAAHARPATPLPHRPARARPADRRTARCRRRHQGPGPAVRDHGQRRPAGLRRRPTPSTSRSPAPPCARCARRSASSPRYRGVPKVTIFGSARIRPDSTGVRAGPRRRPAAGRARVDGRHRRRPGDHGGRHGGRRSRAVDRREHPAAVRAGRQPDHRRRRQARLDEVLLHPQADARQGVAGPSSACPAGSARSTRPSSC